jgi:D-alanyl-D-alanine carboxypeptidase/D-alanyl-D-alanine-endopeptidase (penicillin-binding protein 4)
MKIYTPVSLLLGSASLLLACSPAHQINRSARKNLLHDPSLQQAHIGISIYEPERNKYVYNYQGDKYFVPASNTKLPTCYAVMKHIGDSLPGLEVTEYDHMLLVETTGDPTLLHEDFKHHPVYEFIRSVKDKMIRFTTNWQDRPLGSGWSWDDYDADYMAERSAFPVYGNVVSFIGRNKNIQVVPQKFSMFIKETTDNKSGFLSHVGRSRYSNDFMVSTSGEKEKTVQVPFITSDSLNISLFLDSAHFKNEVVFPNTHYPLPAFNESSKKYTIYSQPTDSLLHLMMHRSDNFYAEQSLLMVSHQVLGVMSDARIIDTLLKTDLKDLPQKPRWADGSGLSRYNLFTPQDFVTILSKMRSDFGMERIKHILPTGNTGTLTNYYKAEQGYLYAKTGTLSGVVSLSGFLYTRKNKLLIFSILVNNHQASASQVRRAVEKFVEAIRLKY